MTTKGKLICFEGLDKSGKTTQIQKLQEIFLFDEIKYKVFKYPRKESTTFQIIELYQSELIDLHPKAAHLLYSANRWESQDDIQGYLNAGYHVILDRYFYSGAAYSNGSNGLDLNWCLQSDSGLLVPDIIFYIDTDPMIRIERTRVGKTQDRYEDEKTQSNVERVYKMFMDKKWVVINGNESVRKITERILDHLGKIIPTDSV